MVRQSSYLVYGPLLAGRRIKGSAHFRARSWLHRAAEPGETLISAHFRAHTGSFYLSHNFNFPPKKCARFPLFLRTHLFSAHFCAHNVTLVRMNVRTVYRPPPSYQLFECARLCALRISHAKKASHWPFSDIGSYNETVFCRSPRVTPSCSFSDDGIICRSHDRGPFHGIHFHIRRFDLVVADSHF